MRPDLNPKSVHIRPFHPSDMRRVLQLEREAFPAAPWDRDLFEWYAHHWPRLFLIALVNAAVAGYCIVRPGRAPGTADLDSIAVFRRHRRHGIGTSLLQSAIARARRRNFDTLGLMVRRDNRAAIDFYLRHGFTRVRTVKDYYEDGATAWRLTRPLRRSRNRADP